MYSLVNPAGRPNRISDYHWNAGGGLGSGGYFQDPVTTSQWIMVTDVIDMAAGTISIYKDGVRRGRVPLSQFHVIPVATTSPFNVGTRNRSSWFKGAVGKVALYDHVLSDAQICAHYEAMTKPAAPPRVAAPATASLTSLAPGRLWWPR
jgi:hypothetical protein